MNKIFFIFLLINFSFLKSYEIIENNSNLKLSLTDQKRIKAKLDNGLLVYVISDPTIKKSAASMIVNAGSWNDPKNGLGMAHLTEHLLFQKTKNSNFFKFISDNDGETNAITSNTHTIYIFSIKNNNFHEALDLFSNFFINPPFSNKKIKTESYVIDEEYEKSKASDSTRLIYVMKEIGNKQHPNHMFSCGNKKTLSKIKKSIISNWYKKHYFAQNMMLCIYTHQPFEEIIKKLSLKFENILSKPSDIKLLNMPIFSEEQKASITYVDSIKNDKNLILFWELPNYFANDSTQSSELLAYALMRANKNSLFERLKKKSLIKDLNISTFQLSNYNKIFYIEIELTDLGFNQKEKIIKKCFKHINALKKHKIPKYIFEEMQKIKSINFEYQLKRDSFNYLLNISEHLTHADFFSYPKEYILAKEFDEKKVDEILNNLNCFSASYFIMHKNSSFEKKEKWLNTKYTNKKLDESLLTSWNNSESKKEIAFPLNPFLPIINIKKSQKSINPVKIADNKYGKIFNIKSPFITPKIDLILNLKTLNTDKVALEIFSSAIKNKLSFLIKQAEEAGLYFDLFFKDKKWTFHIFGYSDKSKNFLAEILKKIRSMHISENEFNLYKSFSKKKIENIKLQLPLILAKYHLDCLFQKDAFLLEEEEKKIKNIDYLYFTNYIKSIFKQGYIEAIFTGNISNKEAKNISDIILKILSFKSYEQIKKENFIKLDNTYKIKIPSNSYGSGVILAINVNPFSFKRLAVLEILSTSMKEPFFNQMRTKQKVAYQVGIREKEIDKNLFQTFLVQSSKLSCNELLYRFEFFIDKFLQKIDKNISQDRFEKIKKAKIKNLTKPFDNIYELSSRYNLLAFHHKDFEFIDKRVDALKNISYKEFIDISKEFLSRKNKKRIAIQVQGKLDSQKILNYKKINPQDLLKPSLLIKN